MGTGEEGIQDIVQHYEMLCPALRPLRDAAEMTITTGPDIITILHTPTPQQTYHITPQKTTTNVPHHTTTNIQHHTTMNHNKPTTPHNSTQHKTISRVGRTGLTAAAWIRVETRFFP